MIPFEQALRIIKSSVGALPAENVSFTLALNRVLAQEVISDADMPPFNKSAMDGYACRKADLGNALEIIDLIPAGKLPSGAIGPGQCARIMTGAMVPPGADFVMMKEHVGINPSGKVYRLTENENENICYRGEDIKAGDIILVPGTKLLPAHLAMLAAVGCTLPLVYKSPRVAVLSTGNELVEPAQIPGDGKIRNSNGYQLAAQVSHMGLSSVYLGIAPDDASTLEGILSDALEKFEVVLISGGVSVGDYDYVPEVLRKLNVKPLFHGINVKPGRHLLLGNRGNCTVMGMPGNPVSSFVMFEVLVKPLLNHLMGCVAKPVKLRLPLEQAYVRKKPDTLFFIPVGITEKGTALPLEYHGSAHINAYTRAGGIMEVPVGVIEIKKGELVDVRPL
jgi:molybdopterin molybdotransferase